MNRELMLKVADVIEKHPEKYEQRYWLRDTSFAVGPLPNLTKADYSRCGTVCCIAGHAVMQGIVAGTRPEIPDMYKPGSGFFDWTEEAAKDLGISEEVADILFAADLEPSIPVPELLRKLADADTDERQHMILETYA